MLNIVLLAGGPSSEHEVSIGSARNIISVLDRSKYNLTLAYISRDLQWNFGADFGHLGQPMNEGQAIDHIRDIGTDIVFIGLHGAFGEDGRIQTLLENAGIRYTGSDSQASSLVMDKFESQKVIRQNGINTIQTVGVDKSDWLNNKAKVLDECRQFGDGMIIKPNDGGSSIGIYKSDRKNLDSNIGEAFKHSDRILVQAFIDGREFSCGVLEKGGEPFALPVTEIVLRESEFFDFESKYDIEKADEITPARLDPEQYDLVQESALKCHDGFGCRGYSRTDFILSGTDLWFLETNTLPGLTGQSILPKQAEAAQISPTSLLDLIIAAGLK